MDEFFPLLTLSKSTDGICCYVVLKGKKEMKQGALVLKDLPKRIERKR